MRLTAHFPIVSFALKNRFATGRIAKRFFPLGKMRPEAAGEEEIWIIDRMMKKER